MNMKEIASLIWTALIILGINGGIIWFLATHLVVFKILFCALLSVAVVAGILFVLCLSFSAILNTVSILNRKLNLKN